MKKVIIINISKTISSSEKAHAYLWRKLKPSKMQLSRFNSKYMVPAKKGKISKDNSLSIIAKIFNRSKLEIHKIYDEGGELLENNEKVIDLIDKLKKNGFKILLIGNSTALHSSLSIEKNLHKKYGPVILSYKIGALVGSRKMFNEALRRLKVKPGDCVYVDYKRENLRVAKKRGMNIVLYKNYGKLKKELNGEIK